MDAFRTHICTNRQETTTWGRGVKRILKNWEKKNWKKKTTTMADNARNSLSPDERNTHTHMNCRWWGQKIQRNLLLQRPVKSTHTRTTTLLHKRTQTAQELVDETRNTRFQLKQCIQNSHDNKFNILYNTLVHMHWNYIPTTTVSIHIQKLPTDKNIS